MGRGLSDLQQSILKLAHQNRQHTPQPITMTYEATVRCSSEELTDVTRRADELHIPLTRIFDAYGLAAFTAGVFDTRPPADELTQRFLQGGIEGAFTRAKVSAKHADLYTHQILEAMYGFQERLPYYVDQDGDLHFRAGGQFSPNEIGKSQYHSAAAAVSRAIRRLEQRGLVVRRQNYPQGGLWLTPDGLELAENLSVKTRTIVPVLTDSNNAARPTLSED